MIHLVIEGMTRIIDKSQWTAGLFVRDVVYPDGTLVMQTAWQPTPSELARLNAGHPIILTIFGPAYQPMLLEVAK